MGLKVVVARSLVERVVSVYYQITVILLSEGKVYMPLRLLQGIVIGMVIGYRYGYSIRVKGI